MEGNVSIQDILRINSPNTYGEPTLYLVLLETVFGQGFEIWD